MNEDEIGLEVFRGESSLHHQEGSSPHWSLSLRCNWLPSSSTFTHKERFLPKSRQVEPVILGLRSRWSSATNPASTFPSPMGPDGNVGLLEVQGHSQPHGDRENQVAFNTIPWAGENMQPADTAAQSPGLAEAVSNLPSDKVFGRKTEKELFCSWPPNV